MSQPFADADRAGRAWRRQLDEAQVLADGVILVGIESNLFIKCLGAVDVRHRHRNQLESKVHISTVPGTPYTLVQDSQPLILDIFQFKSQLWASGLTSARSCLH